MEYLLIIVLGIVVLAIWNRNHDAIAALRDTVDRLEREIDFLRSQFATLSRTSTKAAESPAAATPDPLLTTSPTQPETVHSAHTSAAPMQPITSPPLAKPGESIGISLPGESAPPKPPPAAPSPVSTSPPSVANAAPFHPAPAQSQQPRSARLFSLEQTLGANWLNKIGITSLVIGVAWFVAHELQSWGPAGKILCGFAVSILLLGSGIWLERKPTYRIIARGLLGGGWALAYFTTFAMYHVQAARVLHSLPLDLALMLLVAAGMVGHSLRYRSQTVTSLAFMLAFATLLISHLEDPGRTVAFSLAASAILAIALVVVTTIRHWAMLELCGLVAVYVSHLVWLNQVLPANHASFTEFWPSTALILLYWLIFRLAYVIRTPLDQREENLSSVSAILNSAGVLGLLKFQSAHPEWAFWALVALGVTEMTLAYWARQKRRQAFVVLSTIAVVLLVSSVPFRFHGVSWPVLWLVQAQVLAIAGLRLGEPVFRRLGLLVGVITGGVLALHDVMPLAVERIFATDTNRHWSLAIGLALAAILYWTHAEVYPRRWPHIAVKTIENFALKICSWLALGAAATCLWVVLPYRWLPLGWIALFLVLTFAAHWFRASHPLMQGDVLALITAGLLFFNHVLPLAWFRLSNPDPGTHSVDTALLALAAMAYWLRGELLPRLPPRLPALPRLHPSAWESLILPLISSLGTASAAAALWVALPAPWVPVGWLAMVAALGLASDLIPSIALALQSDALAIAGLIGLGTWDLWRSDWAHRTPVLISVGLLYCAMRRKTVDAARNYVPAAYSWAAVTLLFLLATDIFHDPWIAPVLATLCVASFEIGRFTRKAFLRWQGYTLLALAFFIYLNDEVHAFFRLAGSATALNFTLVGSNLLEVLILVAAGYLLLERTRDTGPVTKAEHIVGLFADALGTFTLAAWLGVRLPHYVPGGDGWIAATWAALATVLLTLALVMRRRTFALQAILLAVMSVLRGLLFDLTGETQADFWHGTLYHLSIAALVLLAALPFAFKLRGPKFWEGASLTPPPPFAEAFQHPEQWFFFAPFGLMIAALAVQLSSGHITIAWSLLGLAAFLLALSVGERSFRLAGVALLLISVAKIVLMDVWNLPTPDRITTFIILGLALIGVSFLYTRFSSTIRRYL